MKRMKPFLIAIISLASSCISANELSPNNVKLWEKRVDVKEFSVIDKAQCDGHLTLSLDRNTVAKGDYAAEFSVHNSADNLYFIVDADFSCSASNKNDCISRDYLAYSPSVNGTLSCWKYQGMTLSIDDDGNVHFDSDNPEEKARIEEAIKQIKAKSSS
jgi:hypothetical protein